VYGLFTGISPSLLTLNHDLSQRLLGNIWEAMEASAAQVK
jgi:hypothetical protein